MRQLKRIAFKKNSVLKRLIVLLLKKCPLAHMGGIELCLQCKGNSLAMLATVQRSRGRRERRRRGKKSINAM